MPWIVSLGSINADFVVRSAEAPSGPGLVAGRDFLRTSGGKAANVAVLAARLGSPAVLLGCVGDDDLAAQALAGPRAAGVDTSRVRRRPGPTGYSGVVVPSDGAKTIVLAPNANDAWGDDAEAVAADVAGAPAGSVLVADLEVPVGLVRAAIAAARQKGWLTILDPSFADRVDDQLLRAVDHVTPDRAETEALTGIDPTTVDRAAEAGAGLLERGVGHAHVKLPDGGCVTCTAEGGVHVVAPEVEPVDATGAGDAFAGALGEALLRGDPPVEAARVAVGASSHAVTGYGSQESYPTADQLRSITERVEVRPL